MAMHEALSRICHTYHDKLLEGSDFRIFGKRNEEGEAMKTYGDGRNLFFIQKQLEDLECHTIDLEDALSKEMIENDENKATIIEKDEAIHNLWVEAAERDAEIAKKDTLLVEKDAQIAALQAQVNPPPEDDPPHDDDDDDDDDADDDDDDDADDNNGGDEWGVEEEEEDPEERVFEEPSDEDSGEEYTPSPARSTHVKKRKCMRSQ